MKQYITFFVVIFMTYGTFSVAHAEVKTGEGAARKYFQKRKKTKKIRKPSSSQKGPRYMALQFGSFTKDKVFNWGNESNESDVSDIFAGVSYRVGEWVNSMDLLFRADFVAYDLKESRAVKLSLMPVVTFPDAASDFPIYFGAGVGMGIFLKQIADEGDLSLDYQIMAGARFYEILESVGLNFEVGLKNHVHVLSDGQVNSTYISAGTVFVF